MGFGLRGSCLVVFGGPCLGVAFAGRVGLCVAGSGGSCVGLGRGLAVFRFFSLCAFETPVRGIHPFLFRIFFLCVALCFGIRFWVLVINLTYYFNNI